MQYQETILSKVYALNPDTMTWPERAVMNQLMIGLEQNRPITQEEIAKSERWIGCHPEHERGIKEGHMDTTLRMVRQIIRDLRIKYHVPVLSDNRGYYLPRTEEEAAEYLKELETKAQSQAKSWFETYGAMKVALNITSPFFEVQSKYYQESNV